METVISRRHSLDLVIGSLIFFFHHFSCIFSCKEFGDYNFGSTNKCINCSSCDFLEEWIARQMQDLVGSSMGFGLTANTTDYCIMFGCWGQQGRLCFLALSVIEAKSMLYWGLRRFYLYLPARHTIYSAIEHHHYCHSPVLLTVKWYFEWLSPP